MKRISLLLVLGVLFFTLNAYSESPVERMVIEEVISATSDTLAMPGTITVYTKSFSLRDASRLGIMYRTTSDSAVNYTPVLQQSTIRPTTEGSYDAKYITTDTLRSAATTSGWYVATIDTLTALPFGRFKIDSTNTGADAVLEMEIVKQ